VGGGAPVVVQSMTNTDTRDPGATLAQIVALAGAGCELARVAVPDEAAVAALPRICAASPLPIIADVHFRSELAVGALEAGVHGLRINPGNLQGGARALDRVVDAAKARGAAIRVGVNAGSIHRRILERFGGPTPEAMVESAVEHVRMLEDRGFEAIKVSLKSSSVPDTLAAYRLMARRRDYPLHIGITEAGTPMRGAVKSAVGIGLLLAEGLGDTVRVSLTGDPIREVEVAWWILAALELRRRGPEIISCPTCGRTEIDLIGLAEAVEERLRGVTDVFSVAVMGCVVNGPGEAREADVGIAGGKGEGVLFRKGQSRGKVTGDTQALLDALMREIGLFLRERDEAKL
jgi:(E)-4-hydroxy-3-methylbut-2-enyl-diphosphate synthase